MRVNANGGAENFFEQKYRRVHVDVPRIRLGPWTCCFKRDRSGVWREKEAVPDETASDEKVEWFFYFALFTGASGIAVSFARIESVCSASPRSSSLYF